MQGPIPAIPFWPAPLGFKPNGTLQWNGLFPAPSFLFNPVAPGLADLARGIEAVETGTWSLVGEERGTAFSTASVGKLGWASDAGEFSGDMTAVVIWRRNAAGAGNQTVLAKRNADTGSAGAEFCLNFNVVGAVYFWHWATSGGWNLTNLGNTNIPAVGQWVTTVVVRKVGSYGAGWQDGVLCVNNSGATGTPTTHVGAVTIADQDNTGAAPGSVDIALAYVIPAAVEDADAAMLSVHPLAPFVPITFATLTSSIFGTTIAPTLASWGWAGGVPNFNSKTNIAGMTGSWAAAGNAPTINQSTIITPSLAVWAWFGRAVTSIGGGSLSGMVQGMVRGFVRLFVRGTNTGRP